MFILGIGQAFMFPAAAKAIATWFTRVLTDFAKSYAGVVPAKS